MTKEASRVLVVDDQKGMRLTLEGIIADEGHRVTAVSDGCQAIEAARKQHFDLVLLDVNMPGLDGVQTFRELRRMRPDTVVVMMTGRVVDERVKQALEEGAHSVIIKPFDIGKVLDIMQAAARAGAVLVVDDQPADRDSLSAVLDQRGYQVDAASSGSEAVEKVRRHHYDVVLMDIRMPGKDGLTSFQEINAIDPEARVIFVTGSAPDGPIKDALESGEYAVAYKPFDVGSMLALVRKLTMSQAK